MDGEGICAYPGCGRDVTKQAVVIGEWRPMFDRAGYDNAVADYRIRAAVEAARGNEQEILKKPQMEEFWLPPAYVERYRFCFNDCAAKWLVDQLAMAADY